MDSQQELLNSLNCPLDLLYKNAVKFYKEKEKSGELAVNYQLRLRFLALSKQAKYGDFNCDVADYGWFNFVGGDVSKEWKKVSETFSEKEKAMFEFVRLLDTICPAFRQHMEEQCELEKKQLPEMAAVADRAPMDQNDATAHMQNIVNEAIVLSPDTIAKFEQQKRMIQEALNRQTYHQFLAYAQQTHPGEPEKQEKLIVQLQEQHYEQYMSQVYTRQAQTQAASIEAAANNIGSNNKVLTPNDHNHHLNSIPPQHSKPMSRQRIQNVDEEDDETNKNDGESSEDEHGHDDCEEPANTKIAPASLWTVKTIKEFKASIQKDGPDGVLKVGHGETVTVRVPTHPEGNSLYWEFSTDYYDIGFGLYFEWTVPGSNAVTVHVEESEDDEETEETPPKPGSGDVESGSSGANIHDPNKPRIDEIIPIFRRDSHQEVIAGSHAYPGTGVYLLKFDNSYSLWRSKTLYFRVFFSKNQ